MANGVQLATAYISLNVRTDDIKKQVQSALDGAGKVGSSTGSSIARNIATSMRSHLGGVGTLMFAPMEIAGIRWAVKAGAAIGGMLKKAIMGAVGGLGLGAIFGAGGVLTAGLDRLKTLQQSTIQLSLKLKPEDIKSLQKQISDVVTGTPISLDKAMQAVPAAINAGLKGDQVKQYIKDIADLTASTGGQGQFDQLAVILGQIRSKGKLAGDEMQQLVDAGVDVRGILKDTFGWDDKTLEKNLTKGKIGINELQKAIQKSFGSTASGGLAKEMGKTFDGAIGSLKASAARLGANFIGAIFGKSANDDPLSGAADGINQITEKLNGMGKWVDAHREDIHTVFMRIGDGALWAGDKIGKISSIFNTVKTAGSSAVDWLSNAWDKVTTAVGKTTTAIKATFNTVKTKISDVVGEIQKKFESIFGENGWFAKQFDRLGKLVDKVREVLGLGPATANAATPDATPSNPGPMAPNAFGPYKSRAGLATGTALDGSDQHIGVAPGSNTPTSGAKPSGPLPDAHGAHKQIAAALSRAQLDGLQMSAGKDDHANDGGLHPKGLAGDFSNQKAFGPNTPEMNKFAGEMLKLAPFIDQLIYSGAPFNVLHGKIVPTIDQPGSPYTTNDAGYHGDHVHLGVKDEMAQQFMDALGTSGLSSSTADIGIKGSATIQLNGPIRIGGSVGGLSAGVTGATATANPNAPVGSEEWLQSQLLGAGLSPDQTRGILAMNRVEGGTRDPRSIFGFTEQQVKDLGFGGGPEGHLNAFLKLQWNDMKRRGPNGSIPGIDASGKATDTNAYLTWIREKIVGQTGVSSDWEGNAQPPISAYQKHLEEAWNGVTPSTPGWGMPGGPENPRKYGSGGNISGPGSGTSDSIPAMLSNGEHVLTAKDVQAMGGQQGVYAFRAALQNGLIPGFAPGGAVDTTGAQNNVTDLTNAAQVAQAQFSEVMGKPDASESEKLSAQQNLSSALRAAAQAQADLPTILAGGTPPDRSAQNDVFNLTDQLAMAKQHQADQQASGNDIPLSQQMQDQFQLEALQRDRNQAVGNLTGQGQDNNYGLDFIRSLGFIPASAGNTGVAGTSSLAGFINMGNSVVSGVIDTGTNLAQMAATAAIAAGTMGAGSAAGPAASMATSYGIQLAGNEAKRISSYWFQMAGIGADALVEQLTPFGTPRYLGYDYGQFAPQLGIQQAFSSTLEKAGGDAIKGAFGANGQQPIVPADPTAPTNTAPSGPAAGGSMSMNLGAPAQTPTTMGAAPGLDTSGAFNTGLDPTLDPNGAGGNGGGGSWARGGAIGIYDNGGVLHPGQLALNASRTPESILTKEQWSAMSANASTTSQRDAPLVGNLYTQDMQDAIRQLDKVKRRDMMQYAGRS